MGGGLDAIDPEGRLPLVELKQEKEDGPDLRGREGVAGRIWARTRGEVSKCVWVCHARLQHLAPLGFEGVSDGPLLAPGDNSRGRGEGSGADASEQVTETQGTITMTVFKPRGTACGIVASRWRGLYQWAMISRVENQGIFRGHQDMLEGKVVAAMGNQLVWDAHRLPELVARELEMEVSLTVYREIPTLPPSLEGPEVIGPEEAAGRIAGWVCEDFKRIREGEGKGGSRTASQAGNPAGPRGGGPWWGNSPSTGPGRRTGGGPRKGRGTRGPGAGKGRWI